ncbi:MAG TPA: hypothetical protein VFZ09_33980 [Archangium sp.]|uniref:GAP1-N1 domain-containing protein n=1 Tax=Archangium sp. TaxID=1872627 RepID=UPI002E37F6FF|nr:hypothetical protein [Archangium sp.]HEX5751283.1 hypothetical protein [Archangium sp.]
MPLLAQTLHGYAQGHRLLASGGDLNERELALLERLSDLSGYLPTGARFESYLTGFPCGERYYALACTWPDVAATRSGTVLTHTVLLSNNEARGLEDLGGLAALHRRPRSAEDREPYREPLPMPAFAPGAAQPPTPGEALAAVVLLFGTEERPILWVDERQPDAVVRFLWSVLRAEQRERFSFCTFALQPRTLEGQPFTFLGIPPAARGSFLEKANSEAWWDSGRLLHPRLAGLTQKEWAAQFAREGATLARRLETFCHEQGLRPPALKDMPTLLRFMELEPAAHERLAAARSRADLFERLWPGLEPTHPAAAPILRGLLERQADATTEPRPLWELTDFISRPLVRGRLETDTGFAAQVERVLVRELARRFELTPERTAEELPQLLAASGARWSDSLLAIVQRVLTRVTDAASRLAPPLLLKAADTPWPELMETALVCLSPLQRQQALAEAVKRTGVPAREALLGLAQEVAGRIDDPGLLLAVGGHRGRVLDALHAITRRMLSKGDVQSLHTRLEPVLSQVDDATRLEWALASGEPSHLAWFAAEIGAQAVRALETGLDALVRKCSGPPNGARLLLLYAEKLQRVEPLTQELRQRPVLARALVVLALQEEGPRIEHLTRVASESIPPEQLLAPELRQALLDTRDQWRVRNLMGRLGPQWLRALCEGSHPPAELASWLDIPMLRQWLRQSMRSQLLSSTSTSEEHHLIPRLAATLRAWLDSPEAYDRDWIPGLLEYLVWNASARELDPACENLAHVLRQLPPRCLDDHLASKLLALVERTRPSSGWHIVELVFSRIHARLLEDEKSLLGALASLLTGKDWDRAKQLRQWLVDTYVSLHWPPESFLRSLRGDPPLFFRLAHRAARTPAGMDFLRRLPSALDAAPELASRWRRPIEEVLANPHRPIDFE